MKRIFSILFASVAVAYAQPTPTGTAALTVNRETGQVVSPSNFATANAPAFASALGATFQPLNNSLTHLAAGSGYTAYGRATLSLVDAAAGRAYFGVVIGQDVQAFDSDLVAFASKTAPFGAVVGTSDTQTLTNNTLNAPAITAPTGIVKADVGLGNVDNTSDANKPVSTAQAAADTAVLNAAAVDATGKANAAQSAAIAAAAAGNAASATTLQTPRTINGVSFDGSANITVPAAAGTLSGATLAANVTASSLTSAAGGAFGTAAFTNTGAYATAAQGSLAATAVQPGSLAAVATSGAYNDLTGRPTLGTAAAQSTSAFEAPLTFSGGVTRASNTVSLANTAVTPGSYAAANITVDATGRITSAANGSGGEVTLAGAQTLLNKTLAGFTQTGPVVAAPTTITTSIDVTKPLSALTITNNSTTLAFSATPATGTRTLLRVTNTDTSAHFFTLPSVFSEALGQNRTTLNVPPQSTLTVGLERRASDWLLIGDPVTIGDLPATATADVATDYTMIFRNGREEKILLEDLPPANLPAVIPEALAESGSDTTGYLISGQRLGEAIAARAPGIDGSAPGDVKFIPDAFSVPTGWSLSGANGVPTFTTPDADFKPVVKLYGTVAAPTFDPIGGELAEDTPITLATATSGATIRYTTNGDTPSRSIGTVYSTPIESSAFTLKAIAYRDYYADSTVASDTYTLPAGPTYFLYKDFEETGTPAGATVVGTVNFDASPGPVTSQYLSISAATSSVSFSFTARSTIYFFFRFRKDTSSTSTNAGIVLFRGGGTTKASMVSRTDNSNRWYHGSTGLGKFNSFTRANGTWYAVWGHYTMGTGGDGFQSLDLTTTNTETKPGVPDSLSDGGGAGTIDEIVFQTGSTGGTFSFDDVILSDTPLGSNPPRL